MSQRKKSAPSTRQGQVERISEASTIRQQIISQTIEGPLPPPQMLAEYERVHPGLSQVIVESFQNETAHRHALEKQAMDVEEYMARSFVTERRRGQHYGLFIAILIVGGAITLGLNGQGWAATVMGGVGFASIVGAFVVGRRPADPVQAKDQSKQDKPAKKKPES